MYHKIIKFNYKYNAFCVEHVFYNKSNSFRDFFFIHNCIQHVILVYQHHPLDALKQSKKRKKYKKYKKKGHRKEKSINKKKNFKIL